MNMMGTSSLVISKTNAKRLEIRDGSGKVVGSVSIRKSKPQKVKKKRLPYSFKEICRFAAAAGAILTADFICREYIYICTASEIYHAYCVILVLFTFYIEQYS